ncbi:MAG: tetratricopeptide repeat protein, partial [Rhodopirellula sp.]|nr:tetratricopeptide repeat protein [Rhodopirellula sp.]
MITGLDSDLSAQQVPLTSPAQVEASDREKQIAERDRLWAQAQQLAADGKRLEGIAAANEVLAIERRVFGETHRELLGTVEWLWRQNLYPDELPQAVAWSEELLRLRQKLDGDDYWATVTERWRVDWMRKLSRTDSTTRRKAVELENSFLAELESRQFEKALAVLFELQNVERGVIGEEHPNYANTWVNAAHCCRELKREAEERSHAQQALRIRSKVLGNQHPDTGHAEMALARVLSRLGEHEAALPHFDRAVATFAAADPDGQFNWGGWAHFDRGVTCTRAGAFETSLSAFERASLHFRKMNYQAGLRASESWRGSQLQNLNRHREAVEALTTAAELYVAAKIHSSAAYEFELLGRSLREVAQPESAVVAFRNSIEQYQLQGGQNADIAKVRKLLADTLVVTGKYEEALEEYTLT